MTSTKGPEAAKPPGPSVQTAFREAGRSTVGRGPTFVPPDAE